MNAPNALTLGRIFAIPFFIFFLLNASGQKSVFALIAAIIFIAAAITDALDGYLARKHHLETDFGRLWDPLADKLLVLSAFICFVQVQPDIVPAWVVVVIIGREFIVTGVRSVASASGKVIAADKSGKVKTVIQMVTVCELLLNGWIRSFTEIPIDKALILLTLAITLYSGTVFMIKNRDAYSMKK
jgi:CDP-diacylglycerol--glycerol-3-phosphate 3-phosphatidyltransferase